MQEIEVLYTVVGVRVVRLSHTVVMMDCTELTGQVLRCKNVHRGQMVWRAVVSDVSRGQGGKQTACRNEEHGDEETMSRGFERSQTSDI